MPALEWGKRMGFIRIFADEGAAVYELLNELAQGKDWVKDGYFKKILAATKMQMLQYPNYLKQERSVDTRAFSDYEKDVMRLLIHGDKNADIARKLFVSENTVKYHLKNIYQKLDVRNRGQAVNKIKENKLV